MASDYRDLVAWQKARAFAAVVYRISQTFPRTEMFGLTSQMRRAVVSVACNIAEGHGRRSTKDRLQFLVIARGSLFELETQLLIATDLEYVAPEVSEKLMKHASNVARLVNGLIRYYETRATAPVHGRRSTANSS